MARPCGWPRLHLTVPQPRFSHAAAMSALGLDIVDFVTVGIECTLRQLLEAGFFHAGGRSHVAGHTARVPAAGQPHPGAGCCASC